MATAPTISDFGKTGAPLQVSHIEAVGHGRSAGKVHCNGNILTTAGNITATAGNIVATAGNIVATAGGITATAGAFTSGKTTNQIVLSGPTYTTTISATQPAASRVLTIADPLAAANIVTSTRGTVTQASSLTTAVELNAPSGVITTVSATTAAVSESKFALTNSLITASSVVLVSIVNYAGTFATNGIPTVKVDTIGSGTCNICVNNVHAANALSGVLKIAFVVM